MSVVFILGAGASYGELLAKLDGYPDAPGGPTPTPPPLANGFFRQSLFDSIHYDGPTAEKDFPEAFDYVRKSRLLSDPVGTGDWDKVDLEQIFTSIELERSFSNPESDRAAKATLVRNQLVRYVQRILSMCTQYCYGQHYKQLASVVEVDDSILTFNWDLLLDQELLGKADGTVAPKVQYNNFWVVTSGRNISRGTPILAGTPGKQGLYLKMHGSFNWYICGNPKCSHSSEIALDIDTQLSLNRTMGIGSVECQSCSSDLLPLLIPPLLNKPISEHGIIRSIWGLARKRLEVASKIVVIGFSVAPTDFYAAWLLRSTVGIRNDVEVFVVNPANDPVSAVNADFKRRMEEIFPRGFKSNFRTFSELAEVLKVVGYK
jgi:hypothetical protein